MKRPLGRGSGQGLQEYGLIVGLLAVVAIGAPLLLGPLLQRLLENLGGSV